MVVISVFDYLFAQSVNEIFVTLEVANARKVLAALIASIQNLRFFMDVYPMKIEKRKDATVTML